MEMYRVAGEFIWSDWKRPLCICSIPVASEANTTIVQCYTTKFAFRINVLIQYRLSSTCFEHLVFIFRKTLLYMQP